MIAEHPVVCRTATHGVLDLGIALAALASPAAVRTRHGVKQIYVSIGHRVDLRSAVRIALTCARRYRLPEPTRAADRAAAQL